MATSSFSVPDTIHSLRQMRDLPYNVGYACGELLEHIVPLVSYHLEHDSNFRNNNPKASVSTVEFASAVDAQLKHARDADDVSGKFADDLLADRKERKPRKKYLEKYTVMMENAFKAEIKEKLRDMFLKWTPEQTRMFNKGLDRRLTGTAWSVYPADNVVLQADGSDWAVWLRGHCDELGMIEGKAGRPVFDKL
ncbi:hypothetical protein BDV95DRAFT_487087 [Massariosphaeria phaeospora]|uniref:Uncharacterized protein n=1 Tax=Massariosphaeria phaeospora TaxID=100035 RepID=A0A7C8IBD7_9PLEO|nr:hypothetical protein BDV95DRAFT_487087 [Massariosphaeria phaeospora]